MTTIQWFADGQRIAGADGVELRVRQQHIGKRITVRTTARSEGYRASGTTSAPTREGRGRPVRHHQSVLRRRRGPSRPLARRRPRAPTCPRTPTVSYTWLRVRQAGRDRAQLRPPGRRRRRADLVAGGPVPPRLPRPVPRPGRRRPGHDDARGGGQGGRQAWPRGRPRPGDRARSRDRARAGDRPDRQAPGVGTPRRRPAAGGPRRSRCRHPHGEGGSYAGTEVVRAGRASADVRIRQP